MSGCRNCYLIRTNRSFVVRDRTGLVYLRASAEEQRGSGAGLAAHGDAILGERERRGWNAVGVMKMLTTGPRTFDSRSFAKRLTCPSVARVSPSQNAGAVPHKRTPRIWGSSDAWAPNEQ